MLQSRQLIFCVLLYSVCKFIDAQKGLPCRTPNNEIANCINILHCEKLIQTLKNLTTERQRFLQESQCGIDIDNNKPLVCCGYKGEYNKINFESYIFDTLPIKHKAKQILPPEGKCGIQAYEDRITNGNETTIDEFPWMALLGYRHKYGGFDDFSCGGVLISKRYVLTAAHCVKNWQLYKVRLGEHDITTKVDCEIKYDGDDCNDPPVDYLIEDIITHPGYFHNESIIINDIALIRLDSDVNFTFFISPICLPLNCIKPKPGSKVWVAGWGRTEQNVHSTVKRKADLIVTDQQSCMDNYKQYGIQIKESTQICALGEDGKDSCKGDSGGPLMKIAFKTVEIWYVFGIVSFGLLKCGTHVPGVYTDVVDFIQWILETITI